MSRPSSELGRDLTAAAGFVALAAGLALVSPALALIVCGALLLLIAAWPLLADRPRKP